MQREVPEADWKQFRDLREQILERFCRRVLGEIEPLFRDTGETYHQRYLDVFQLLKDRDRDLAQAFDDPRRSRMIRQLATMHVHGLVAPDDLALFTPSTRAAVETLAQTGAR